MKNTPMFTRLYLAKLGVDNAYALVHASVQLAQQASLHFDPLTRQAALYMAECNAALEANLKTAGLQEHTRQIRALDHQCGLQWASLKRSVTYYAKDGTEAQQAAAKAWVLFLQPYGRLPQAALNTQMALLSELLQKYHANTDLCKAAQVLGLEDRIESLQTLNEALGAVYMQRNVQAAGRTRSNSQLKMDSLKAYRRFCALLEQACLYTGSKPLLALVAELNGYRSKYQALVARHTTTHPVATHEVALAVALAHPASTEVAPMEVYTDEPTDTALHSQVEGVVPMQGADTDYQAMAAYPAPAATAYVAASETDETTGTDRSGIEATKMPAAPLVENSRQLVTHAVHAMAKGGNKLMRGNTAHRLARKARQVPSIR